MEAKINFLITWVIIVSVIWFYRWLNEEEE